MVRRKSFAPLVVASVVLALMSGRHSAAQFNSDAPAVTSDQDPPGATATKEPAQTESGKLGPSEYESSDHPESLRTQATDSLLAAETCGPRLTTYTNTTIVCDVCQFPFLDYNGARNCASTVTKIPSGSNGVYVQIVDSDPNDLSVYLESYGNYPSVELPLQLIQGGSGYFWSSVDIWDFYGYPVNARWYLRVCEHGLWCNDGYVNYWDLFPCYQPDHCLNDGYCDPDENPCLTADCPGCCSSSDCGNCQYCSTSNTCDNYACCSPSDCSDPCDTCSGHTCVPLGCGYCQYCSNHTCATYDCCTNPDCDDGKPCTSNLCINHVCSNPWIGDCMAPGDCDDVNACTSDDCVNCSCQHSPIGECTQNADCVDGDSCTTNECINCMCQFTPIGNCSIDPDCDDQNACTSDQCVGCVCQHTPVSECVYDTDCIDTDPCTTDQCVNCLCEHSTTGSCAVDADCDDLNACTTNACVNCACAYTPIGNCTNNADCDDGSPCTTDECVNCICQNPVIETCGNGTCEPSCGEDCDTCLDCACGPCGICAAGVCQDNCGNGLCEASCAETCNNCLDCVTGCGDGCCLGNETCVSCPEDCLDGPCCGDSYCDLSAGEDSCTCAVDCGGTCCPNGACEGSENPCNCPDDCGPPSRGEGEGVRTGLAENASDSVVPIPHGTVTRVAAVRVGPTASEAQTLGTKFLQYQNVDTSGFYFDSKGTKIADDIHEDPTLPLSTITEITFAYCVQGSTPSGTWAAVISILAADPADVVCAPPVCSYTLQVPDNPGPSALACNTVNVTGLTCEKPGPDYWIEVDYAGAPIIDLADGLGPIPHGGPRVVNFASVGSSHDLFLSNDPGDCSQRFYFGGCPPVGPYCGNFYHEIWGVGTGTGTCTVPDLDGDNVCDQCDNCPNTANGNQLDNDGDGLGNACDNCPDDVNPDQKDCNADGVGDVCAIRSGLTGDCNRNLTPDDCDVDPTDPDGNGLVSVDCNANGVPDECDVNQPPNVDPAEQCDGAISVCPNVRYTGTTAASSNDGGASCGSSNSSPDVWYLYTPATSGSLTVSLCGSLYDTVVSVHSACPGGAGNEFGCNDDFCDLQSTVTLTVTAGTEYRIRVTGYNGNTGDFTMMLTGPDCASRTTNDCNGNAIPDDCDIAGCGANDTSCGDCNGNGRPDSCDIADGAVDANGDGRPDECDCCVTSAPESVQVINSISGMSLGTLTANRTLSIRVPVDPGCTKRAIRVIFDNLAPPYDIWNGQQLWVGAPLLTSESGSTPDPTPGFPSSYWAKLQCAPECRNDWSTFGDMYLYHEGIVPGSTYKVSVVDCENVACMDDESNFSTPLSLGTSVYGDTIGDCSTTPCSPPDGPPVNVSDALGVLGAFSSAAGAPRKARCDIEPRDLDRTINVTDALRVLDGFSGLPYPFTPSTSIACP